MIPRFLAHLQDNDLSPHTVKNYEYTLNRFAQWFEKAGGQSGFIPARVTPLDLREWRRELQSQRQKPGTINQKMALLTAFFDWCVAENVVAANPARGVKRLKQVASPPKWLTRPQAYALLRTTEERVQLADLKRLAVSRLLARRNAAMIGLMLHAGPLPVIRNYARPNRGGCSIATTNRFTRARFSNTWRSSGGSPGWNSS